MLGACFPGHFGQMQRLWDLLGVRSGLTAAWCGLCWNWQDPRNGGILWDPVKTSSKLNPEWIAGIVSEASVMLREIALHHDQ